MPSRNSQSCEACEQPAMPAEKRRLAKMLKALGNPIRFQIMETLAECKTCITNQIVASTSLAQSTVSQHLQVLREAGLIHGEIDGPATCYCLDPEGVRWLKDQIESWLPGCCSPQLTVPLKHETQGEKQ